MPSPRVRRLARPALLVVVLVALWWFASRSELVRGLTAEGLRAHVAGAGALGPLLYLAAFVAGALAQVPGIVFVVAARLAFGPLPGFFIAYVGSVVAGAIAFAFVRTIGGKPLGDLRFGPARRLLSRLEAHPVLTVAMLRAALLLSPPLNTALALTRVTHRDHLVGSLAGLVVPVAVIVFLSEAVLALARGLF